MCQKARSIHDRNDARRQNSALCSAPNGAAVRQVTQAKHSAAWRKTLIVAPFAAALLMALILSACAPTTIKRGHHFRASDLTQIQEGMTKDQVTQILGTPDTTSPVGSGLGYYYISSIEKQNSFFKPDEVDRKVVAVYFNRLESVERISQYGMRDGKVFDFIDRKTKTHARDEGVLKSLFRNLGKKQGIF